jgi:polyisoprenoid-binding protein YceI
MTTQSRVPLWAGLVGAALTFCVIAQARAPAVAAANWRIDPARTHIAFAIDAVGYPRTHGQFRQRLP